MKKVFDEIVEYALEGRRRVKEQLNKRKPDNEYANINMSYINKDGEKIVVYCPESKYSVATQNPRKDPDIKIMTNPKAEIEKQQPDVAEVKPLEENKSAVEVKFEDNVIEDNGPKEKTLDIIKCLKSNLRHLYSFLL